jgi:hypothetical protein
MPRIDSERRAGVDFRAGGYHPSGSKRDFRKVEAPGVGVTPVHNVLSLNADDRHGPRSMFFEKSAKAGRGTRPFGAFSRNYQKPRKLGEARQNAILRVQPLLGV